MLSRWLRPLLEHGLPAHAHSATELVRMVLEVLGDYSIVTTIPPETTLALCKKLAVSTSAAAKAHYARILAALCHTGSRQLPKNQTVVAEYLFKSQKIQSNTAASNIYPKAWFDVRRGGDSFVDPARRSEYHDAFVWMLMGVQPRRMGDWRAQQAEGTWSADEVRAVFALVLLSLIIERGRCFRACFLSVSRFMCLRCLFLARLAADFGVCG